MSIEEHGKLPEPEQTPDASACGGESPSPSQPAAPAPSQLNAMEKFYERFRGVPLRNIDIFIGICAGAFLVVVVLGMLKGRGII